MMKEMLKPIIRTASLLFLIAITPVFAVGAKEPLPIMGLSPDPGFPVWITADPENYLPLSASQTSGMSWYGSDKTPEGFHRDYMIIVDDDDIGGIHFIDITDTPSGPKLTFHYPDLTLPEPGVAGFRFRSGYDWEAFSIHQSTKTFFIAQEGHADEIAVYHGRISPAPFRPDPNSGLSNNFGEIRMFPGSLTNIRKLNLPGWNEAFGGKFSDNIGIEGLACSDDRLFAGLESPYDYNTRIISECSTILAIWSINPSNPLDMENCELLAVHDTADWKKSLGFTIETICGLHAIDRNRVIGIDRDNLRLFAVEFDDSGNFIGGRIFILDAPGPAPLESDSCPPRESLPKLVKPSLESITAVPVYSDAESEFPSAYKIYLACDPWAPGWRIADLTWGCPAYRDRLNALLPAMYRYTVSVRTLFPQTESDLLLVGNRPAIRNSE
ncbi:MAG TPA: hypothetical protein ENN67_01575 [Firmicutes bacterium]|nr:hypothetical protein [Bacillota bacterium]